MKTTGWVGAGIVAGALMIAGAARAQQDSTMQAGDAAPVDEAQQAFKDAVMLHDDGRTEEAIKAYKQILKTNDKHAGVYANLGLVYMQTGKIDDAIEAYRKAVELDTEDEDAGYNLGALYGEKRKYKEAINAFDAALMKPSNAQKADIHINLGNAHLGVKNYEGAIASYENALKIDAKAAAACYNMALAYARMKNVEKVIDSLLAYVDNAPDAEDAAQVKQWIVDLGKGN